ncbi:MAG: type II secretion system F family protein [Candidatus Hodarchaeota archaeon]
MIEFILAGVFVSITLLSIAIYLYYINHSQKSEQNIKRRLSDFSKKDEDDTKIPFLIEDDQLSQIPLLNRILEKLQISKKLTHLLEQTDLSLKVGQLILIMMVFGMLGVVFTIKTGNLVLTLMSFILLSCLPLFYVHSRKARRLKSFILQFPDAIDMIISSLRAGHAFNKAMQLVSIEAPAPVGIEFRRAFEENSLGLSLQEVLNNLTQRVDSADLKLFVMAVLLQRETGGNLTEILEKISLTIRERFKLIGQIKTYTAQGRMSMWIIGFLPLSFALVVSVINPDYLKPLFSEPIGKLLLATAIFLQIVGFLIIKKIVQIKYQ